MTIISVPSYSHRIIVPLASAHACSVLPFISLIVFAPIEFTLSVTDPVLVKFVLNTKDCPVAYAVICASTVKTYAFALPVVTA